MSKIKRRRLEELPVHCRPGTKVGEYVPFYFCPRSIMLYILHRGNHPELSYRGGQGPIVHLQVDLHETVRFAEQQQRAWAFTAVNAGTRFADFYSSVDRLDEIDWSAVASHDFGNPTNKERKQAEFLLYDSFPWSLVERAGVLNRAMAVRVRKLIAAGGHCPQVTVEPDWYF